MPPLMPLLALLCAVAGVLCIFASTLFGVSHLRIYFLVPQKVSLCWA